jgi:hypothetical protein
MPTPRLLEARPDTRQPFQLVCKFNTGVVTVDLCGLIFSDDRFKPLRDPRMFALARVNEVGGGIEWPDTDIDYSAFNLARIGESLQPQRMCDINVTEDGSDSS